MIALVEKGRKATFHARYRATPSGEQAAGQELTLELWRKPPLEREDTLFVAQGARSHSAGFLRPDAAALCTRRNEEPWQCKPLPELPRTGSEALVGQLSETVQGLSRHLTIRPRRGCRRRRPRAWPGRSP